MIKVTRLNMKEIVVNADLIEHMEATPDVVISMTTGNKIVVRNSLDEIIEKIMDYKAKTAYNFMHLFQSKSPKNAKDIIEN